jgi:hypothetical protein
MAGSSSRLCSAGLILVGNATGFEVVGSDRGTAFMCSGLATWEDPLWGLESVRGCGTAMCVCYCGAPVLEVVHLFWKGLVS